MNESTVTRVKELLKLPLYQPIESPEFIEENRNAQQSCMERFQLIVNAFAAFPERGMLVDFGCNTGWFCRAFSYMGWRTLGVDRSSEWLEAAELLNELAGKLKPGYVQADVLDVFETEGVPYCDIALCLSVAMYLFEDPDKGWLFFRNVSRIAKVMFVDFGGMYADRLPFTEETVGEFMLANTEFRSWRKIGDSSIGRPIFIFTRA